MPEPPRVRMDPLADDLGLDSIDEQLEEGIEQPHRLAGVGAALGSCFSLMAVVLAIGTAGSISAPRSGIAGDELGAAKASPRESDESQLSEGIGAPAETTRQAVVSLEDQLNLQALERAALLARSQVEAAESKLALLDAADRREALERAGQGQSKAIAVESGGSPFDWMTEEQLATRTRERARTRLADDLATLTARREAARQDLRRLREAAMDAEEALEQARRSVQAAAPEATPRQGELIPRASLPYWKADTAGARTGDLRGLIERHRALLIGSGSSAPTPD